MALAEATITFDLSDMLGTDFDSRRTKVWVTTNVDNDTVIDTDGNKIRLGSGNVTIATDGTGSLTTWIPGVGANPASWQTYIHVDYPDRNATKGRGSRTFGPFTITVSADLADLVQQAEVPPETVGGDAWLATIDADDTSQFRVQQDARFTATYATPATVTTRERLRVPAFDALRMALADGTRSTAVQVMSDSTGDAADEWPYTLAQEFATDHPDWTVHHRLWSDASQAFLATSVIQTGTAGALHLDCSTGTVTRRTEPSAVPHLTGSMDIRVKLSVADWTPTAGKTFIGRSGADGVRGWYAGIQASTGRPQFTYSTDGLAGTLASMTVLAAPTVTDGSTIWLRWVFTPDNGAAQRTLSAYQSSDGVTWTQIGATVTTAGAVTVFDNSATVGVEIGGAASGIGDTTAKIYEVALLDGIDGPNKVPALPDLWLPYTSASARTVGAPVLTFVNAARSGATISYWSDATRLPKATPDYGQALILLSDSHNEGQVFGPGFVSTYDTWRLAVEAQVPASPSIVLTQNPENTGTPWYREHAKRRLDIIGYARQKGLGLIDTYQVFLDAGWPGALMLDDVHPNAAGQVVWRDAILAAYDAT